MRDNDSKLIFENYQQKLFNEALAPEALAGRLANLDPSEALKTIRAMKQGDKSQGQYEVRKAIANLITSTEQNPMIKKFKEVVWPKIKELLGVESKPGVEGSSDGQPAPAIDKSPSNDVENTIVAPKKHNTITSLPPKVKSEDEIDVEKSDLDDDGELSEYEKARGAAIDKARGGNGKMPEKK